VTRWPARSHRSANPPPTLPLPYTVILMFISPYVSSYRVLGEDTEYRGLVWK
jgi:hypothetical protein